MSQSSLSNNNYEKYINKRNTDASPEELKKKVNKEKELNEKRKEEELKRKIKEEEELNKKRIEEELNQKEK